MVGCSFVFCKQKTAYEMRISDWSSDVCSSDLAFDIIGACNAIVDVPAALHNPLVGGDIVAHEAENHHHDMLRDADRVAVGDFGNRNAAIDRRLKVDKIGRAHV